MFSLGAYLNLDHHFQVLSMHTWPTVTVQTDVGQEDGGEQVRGLRGSRGAVKHVSFTRVTQGPQKGFE